MKLKNQIIKRRSTSGAFFPNNNFKSFSKGVKFKSKHITLLLLDLFSTAGTFKSFRVMGENPWLIVALCRLMCPPKACPIPNSRPQIEHSCIFGLSPAELWSLVRSLCSSSVNLGLLWLARWPPSAWNDENWRLQVLHSKTGTPREVFFG